MELRLIPGLRCYAAASNGKIFNTTYAIPREVVPSGAKPLVNVVTSE